MRTKRHGLTLNGKIRKVKPCRQVFSIIRLEYPECNTRRWFFGQDDLLWRCSSKHTEVSELSISPHHPVRSEGQGFQDASCRSPQCRIGGQYPTALLQRLWLHPASPACLCDPKKHYTRSLEHFVIDLCRVATIQDVAELTGLRWDTVKEIHKRHLRRKYKSFNLKNVRYLAIDEVYLGKKRKYITIVLDLRTGPVIHMGRGKGKDALKGFWKRLRRSKAKIQAVATDMASGYIAAVLEHLPKADLVLDHFHLVKWFNEKLSLLRRQLYREATQMEKAVLKGSRWLLVKAPEHLKSHRDPKKDERRR